jgi:surfeit locus 1 family protein
MNKRAFHATLVIVIGVFGTIFLVYLGLWQLERHEWKQQIVQKMRQAPTQKPISILDVNRHNMKKFEFKRTYVWGKWSKAHNIFITGRSYGKRIGYHLLGIVKMTNKTNMLVNFGWVAHKQLIGRNIDNADFIGRLRIASKPGWFAPRHKPEQQEFSSIDIEAISEASGVNLLPYYVDFVRESGECQPFPVVNEIRVFEGHFGYAIIWFVLAFFWVLGFVHIWIMTHKNDELA